MFTLKIESAAGQIVELTHNKSNYAVVGVSGLTPPATTINTATAGLIDGSFFNSARVEQRNIVITVILRGDIEANRQRLYRIFPRKMPVTVYFKNKNRNVKIEGYVEVLEGDLFVQQEQIQISLICPRPYWQDMLTIRREINKVLALFEFPFSISEPIPFSELLDAPRVVVDNAGDVETGILLTLSMEDSVTGLKITNITTGTYIGFDYTFDAKDIITVSTVQGSLYAKLNRLGTEINLLNFMIEGSSWLRLGIGENELTYTVETGSADDVQANVEFQTLYGGV